MLNPLGEEIPQVPVTLPTLKVADFDIEAEAKEAAARIAERRVIRAGLDAWAAINKAEIIRGLESYRCGSRNRQGASPPRYGRQSGMGPELFPRIRRLDEGARPRPDAEVGAQRRH